MKCKTFKIHLQDETGNFDEMKFNKFLENVTLSQTFASVINGDEILMVLSIVGIKNQLII